LYEHGGVDVLGPPPGDILSLGWVFDEVNHSAAGFAQHEPLALGVQLEGEVHFRRIG
jgi:hypothetical protein